MRKKFCEYIGQYIFCRNIAKLHLTTLDIFANEVITVLIISIYNSSSVWVKLNPFNNVQSQIAFFVVFVKTIYLASTKKVATVSCFLKDYNIKLSVILKIIWILSPIWVSPTNEIKVILPTLLLGVVYTWRWKFTELAQICTECRNFMQ